MARFFFNLAGAQSDEEGADLPDLDAAQTEAVSFLGAYLADHPEFARVGHWTVEVTDNRGQVLLSVKVAVDESPRRP